MGHWFVTFAYIFFCYGISVIFTQGEGPFGVFRKIREFAEDFSDNTGLLFRCMLCFPTNVGIVTSLMNWFLLPSVRMTPFNMILQETGLWWAAAIMDGCLVGGICHMLWNIDDYIDKNTPVFEDEPDEEKIILND